MEMATAKNVHAVNVDKALMERLLTAFEKATGAEPSIKSLVEGALKEKAEYYEKRSLVAKHR
ncbi:hypothetical protein [Leptospira kmetyi]|uniref:hypothetical protein n=1 Tax=Leptospira kmetyi TaxID=408139 RepID=UPI003EC04814